MSKNTKVALVALGLAASGALACGANTTDTPASTPPNDTSVATPMSAVVMDASAPVSMIGASVPSTTTADTSAPMTAPPSPADAAAPSLTDAQIATIVGTANGGELAQAQDAMKKAKNPKVVGFARHMILDHGQAGKDLADIQKNGKLETAPTDTSRQIETDGKAILANLQSTPVVADYERQYMDAQVTEHQQLLDALDTKLISGAQNADLKTFLQKVREKVADHLRMAKDIRSAMK